MSKALETLSPTDQAALGLALDPVLIAFLNAHRNEFISPDSLAVSLNNRLKLTDGPMEVTSVVLGNVVVADLDGGAGGGPAVYLPRGTIHINAPRLGINQTFTITNASSTEMPGFVKVPLSSPANNDATTVYFKYAQSQYDVAIAPITPSATGGAVRIVSIINGIVSAYDGVTVKSYDEWKLGTQAWPDLAGADKPFLRDLNNGVYGTGNKWLAPRNFFNARGFKDATFTVNNAESPNLAGYCEIAISDPSAAHLLAFNTNTGLYVNFPYAQFKTTFAQGGSSIIPVAVGWGDQVFSSFPVRQTIAPDAPISGAYLYLIEGRPLSFYPQALYADRQGVDKRVTTLTSVALDGSTTSITNPAMLDAEQFSSTARIVSRTNSVDGPQKDRRYQVDMTVIKGPPAGSGSIIVHLSGDSLTANRRPDFTGVALAGLGYSPTLIGTMNCDGAGYYKGEGRPGWQAADYTHENPRYPGIEEGGVPAYLALSEAEKQGINPYIRRPRAGDDPDRIKNGWIYDFADYLLKFSLPAPQHVLVNLGTNDAYQAGGAAAADQVTRSFNNIFTSIRAALPTAHIYAVVTAVARASDQDDRWAGSVRVAQVTAIRDMVRYRRASLSDTRVWFVPAYQHQNPEDNWPTYLISQNAQTQTQLRGFSDALHYGSEGRRQVAEAEIAAIHACHNLGYSGAKQTPLLGAVNSWTQLNRFASAAISNLNVGTELAVSINSAPNPAISQHGTAINGITAAVGAWLNSATGPSYNAIKSRSGVVGTYAAIQSGDMLGAYRFGGDDGVGIRNGPFMSCVATEAWTAAARGSRLSFSGPPNGSTVAAELLGMQAGVGLTFGGASNVFLDANRHFITDLRTVETLPTVGTARRLCAVSNALAPAWNATLVGGGAVRCLAWDNGTAWTAH